MSRIVVSLDGVIEDPAGRDEVDGGASRDSLFFLGDDAAEAFDVSATGRRVRFTRDVGNITMKLSDLEEIDTLAGRGADTFAIGDLSATPIELVAGLPAKVNITHTEIASDTLATDTRDDTVDTSGLADGTVWLELD